MGNQEILTSDNVAVRCSATVAYAVADPLRVRQTVYMEHAGHLVIQAALRNVIAAYPAEDLLRNRATISQAVEDAARPELSALGLRLDKLDVRDLILPAEMRRAFNQVLIAQQDGLAALERARGENASLRSLANAAKALENNPALLQLRMLQAVESGKATLLVDGSGRQSISIEPQSRA
ncbi:MAG TPA: SPFH domain-containing protein [Fimbriimonadaceae bacterium]|nr:SPFH domain-containing protein [Fimbriimonadaceae bacterium]